MVYYPALERLHHLRGSMTPLARHIHIYIHIQWAAYLSFWRVPSSCLHLAGPGAGRGPEEGQCGAGPGVDREGGGRGRPHMARHGWGRLGRHDRERAAAAAVRLPLARPLAAAQPPRKPAAGVSSACPPLVQMLSLPSSLLRL